MPADRTQLVAQLAAAFPQREIGPETVAVYVRALADIPTEELEPIAMAYMREGEWFPTIRDLRLGVIERRLQLPSVDEAWLQVLEWAAAPAKVKCTAPGCDRGVQPGGEPVKLDRRGLKKITDRHLRASLERIISSAAEPTRLCDTCHGESEIANPDRPVLSAPVRQAAEHIGGAAGINTTENLGILRSQFLKAYDRARQDALRSENLATLALQSGGQIRAIEAER